VQNLSVPRSKNGVQYFPQADFEQLFNESEKLKQQNQELKDENARLKTRIKMHDSEMMRKEKAIEDFYAQNQFI
jgi:cell division protein FtsB